MIKANENERRDFFRIDDDIYLDIKVISEEEYKLAPETLNNLQNSSFSLSADFATLNNNIHPILNNIRQLNPDVAEYLEALNTKIDNLSQTILCNSGEFDESKIINANISASGIQYKTAQNLKIHDKVKLELVLLPEKIGLLIFGKVVNIKDTTDNENNTCIEFEYLRPEDQELMIKHNLNKQMSALRDKNDNN